jgi:hypothetical protein
VILRWTARGFVWSLGDEWGENGPFASYREAIDDYEIYRQSQDAAVSANSGREQAPPPSERLQAPMGPKASAPLSFLDFPLRSQPYDVVDLYGDRSHITIYPRFSMTRE